MKNLFTLLSLTVLFFSDNYAQTTQTFNSTGAMQSFIVPACVNSISIDANGAQGGFGTPMFGGLGARIIGTFAVNPGDSIVILVGGQGQSSSNSGGGGGGSFVYNQTTTTLLLAAGGGGGGGNQGTGDPGQAGTSGTNGHNAGFGTGGSNGGGGGGASGYGTGGGGGYCGNGGNGTTLLYSTGGIGGNGCFNGTDGNGTVCTVSKGMSFLNGGAGGTWSGCTTSGGNGGFGGGGAAIVGNYNGGGGGGYSGGGGSGGNDNPVFQGGGGGGSFNSGTNQTNTTGVRSGNGQVIFTYINTSPAPAGTISGDSLVCAGETVTYSLSPVNGASTYTWTVPAGSVINSGQGTTSVSVTFGSTSGNVTVTPGNPCGSSAATLHAISVNPSPNLNLGNDTARCGGTLTLDAQNSGSNYLWSDSSTTQTVVVSTSGTYSVRVTDGNGCIARDSITIMIHTIPTVTFVLNPDTVCLSLPSFLLTGGSPSGGAYSGPGVNTGSFNPNTAGVGVHNLIYSYTDTNNCSSIDTTQIFVDVCLGIQVVSENQSISIFPNPFSVQTTLENNNLFRNATLSVYNKFGQAVKEIKNISGKSFAFTRDNLASGIYFIRLTEGNKIMVESKLVIMD